MFNYFDLLPVAENELHDKEFVAFDIETTGLYPGQDRITEIGAVRFSCERNLAEFSQLIDPCFPISREATRVSGITNPMVNGKPQIHEILPALLDFFGDSIIVAHNAKFDCSFLAKALRENHRSYFSNTVIDTRLLVKRLWPGLPGYGLERVLHELSLPHTKLHRALADASACRDVFIACLNKIETDRPVLFFQLKRVGFVLTEDDIDETV